MKAITLITLFVTMLFLQGIYAQSVTPPINAEITYIGNEGFMIENNGKKLIIDAIYYHYSPGWGVVVVDLSVEKLLLEGQAPFSNIQLAMVTHNHPDHYDAVKMPQFLTNNPLAKLVCPTPDMIPPSDSAVLPQVVFLSAAKNATIDTTVNGFPITVYNVLHNQAWGNIYNSAYYVDINGLKILHMGDNIIDDSTEIINYKFYQKHIDILFVNLGDYEDPVKIALVKKYINPEFIILMHIAPEDLSWKGPIFKQYAPHVFFFNASMEKIRFTDSIRWENRMPDSVTYVSDTTIKMNTNFDFKVPDLFSDPDTNDSLTYSVSGLPTGLTFDNGSMIISGTPTKAGIFPVEIKATDKSLCSNSMDFNMIVQSVQSSLNTAQTSANVYPTVFSNEIHVKNLNSGSAILVYAMDGTLLKTIQAHGSSVQIDLSALTTGTYIVRIEDKTAVYSKRIVKCFE